MKKTENLDSKLQILTPNQEIFKNSRKFSFFKQFFIIFHFFYFPCPWHLKSRKAMKINEKQSKTSKNKGKRKKMKLQMKKHEVANEKKEVWWQKVMNKNEKNEDKMEKMIMKMKMKMTMKMKKMKKK